MMCATTNVAEPDLYVLTLREYKNRLVLVKKPTYRSEKNQHPTKCN